ncbi:MAG: hypothetical protein M1326_02735, partial [Cyanobacteria bacterium]|nr:hypothetical protein [Cyanobacteriota bacterium]
MSNKNNSYKYNKKYFIPFWGINDDINENLIYKKMKEYSKVGIEELITWFNTGCEIEFLSEEFFKKYSYIIDVAKKFNIKLWIYDDYNWPSGSSAGRITDEYPEFRQEFLEYSILDNTKAEGIFTSNKMVDAFLISNNGKITELKDCFRFNYINYNKLKNNEKILVFFKDFFEGNTGASSGAKWSRNNSFYTDLLNKKAVDKFIELNLESFKSNFNKEFGKTIVGVFTDEPAILMRFSGIGFNFPEGFTYPWTEGIEEYFLKDHNYDLISNLYKLVLDSPDFQRTRIDFFNTVSKLYLSAFHKNISNWCKNNNLKLTGHILFEEEIFQLFASETNFYMNMANYDIPGIDTLGSQTGVDIIKRDIAPKLLGSLRNIENLKTALCEVFAVTGWKLNFEIMKRIVSWLAISGINVIVPTSVANSIKGLRKRLAPPVLDNQPYWNGFEDFIDFFASISFILENSIDISKIGVLYPTINFWANFNADPASRGKGWSDIEDFIIKETNNLIRNQVNFNYIFEEIAKDSYLKLRDGEIYFKNVILKVLILPPITYLSDEIYKFIQKFIKLGGVIINTSRIVSDSFKNKDSSIINIEYNQSFISKILEQNSIIENALYKIIGRNKDFIYSSIRKYNDNINILLLSNQNNDIDFTGRLIINKKINNKDIRRVEIWQIEERLFYDITDFIEIHNNEIIVDILLAKNDFIFLVLNTNNGISNDLRTGLKLRKSETSKIIADLNKKSIAPNKYYFLFKDPGFKNKVKIQFIDKDQWKFQVDNNFFAIEKVKIKADKNFIGKKIGYFKNDFSTKDWQEIRISNISDFNYMACEDTIEGYYTPEEIKEPSINFWIKGEFIINNIPDEIYLVYEDLGVVHAIYINGLIINDRRESFYVWDNSNKKVNIKNYLIKGKNMISIMTRTLSWKGHWHAQQYIEPIVLIGDFSVKDGKIERKIERIKLNSWDKEGFPYYCGVASTALVTIQRLGSNTALYTVLGRDC